MIVSSWFFLLSPNLLLKLKTKSEKLKTKSEKLKVKTTRQILGCSFNF